MAGFLARVAGMGRAGRLLALSLGSIAALWFVGPFGTATTMDAATRAQFFLATCIVIQAACLAMAWLVRRLRPDIARWQLLAVVALCGAVPGAFVVRAGLGLWAPAALAQLTLPELFAQVLFVNAGMFLIAALLMRAAAGARPQTARSANPLAERLPLHLRKAAIQAIEAQDHYLQVHTTRGAAMVHMTMQEAETLLGETEGLRVHRSYWVSLPAIERELRRNGELALLIEGGMEVPVSRRRAKAVREALRLA